MKSLGRMVRFVKPYWRQVALALLLLVGMTASDLLIPRLTQRLIDRRRRQVFQVTLIGSLADLGAPMQVAHPLAHSLPRRGPGPVVVGIAKHLEVARVVNRRLHA